MSFQLIVTAYFGQMMYRVNSENNVVGVPQVQGLYIKFDSIIIDKRVVENQAKKKRLKPLFVKGKSVFNS